MYRLVTLGNDILSKSNNIAWNSDTDTLGIQLSFESVVGIKEGAVVSLFNETRELFRGVIIKRSQKRWTWDYICQDYSFYLKNKVIKQFNGVAASDAIKSLLGEAYIVGDVVSIPTKIKQIYKNKSLSEIIDDILDQAKADQGIEYFKEIEGNVLYVRKVQEMIIAPKIIMPKELTIETNIENMKNKIQIVVNSEDNNAVIASAEDTSQQGWYGLLSDMQEVDDKDKAKAQNIADNALKESNVIECSCSFETIAISGADDIKAYRSFNIIAGSRLNGYYKIKSAGHTLNKGLHKINLTIEWTVKP